MSSKCFHCTTRRNFQESLSTLPQLAHSLEDSFILPLTLRSRGSDLIAYIPYFLFPSSSFILILALSLGTGNIDGCKEYLLEELLKPKDVASAMLCWDSPGSGTS